MQRNKTYAINKKHMIKKKASLVQNAKGTVTFYINRGKKYLPKNRKHLFALVKEELRILFGN